MISLSEWQQLKRPQIKQAWLALLGQPSFDTFDSTATLLQEETFEEFHASLWLVPTGPDLQQKIICLRPRTLSESPRPCAVIPFYHPEDSAGLARDSEMHGLKLAEPTPHFETRSYGVHLVRKGYIVACTEAFPYNLLPGREDTNPHFAKWQEAADKLLQEHPHWTGMGKLMHDTQCGIRFLLEQPGSDARRLLLMGHSLGGKTAFYTGTLDDRVSAVIASDFGLPWDSTNWDASWYFGEKRPSLESEMTQLQLLQLMAPRPFFLISGANDSTRSWEIMEAAKETYALYGKSENLTGFDHATGHVPTEEALNAAYQWLEKIHYAHH